VSQENKEKLFDILQAMCKPCFTSNW